MYRTKNFYREKDWNDWEYHMRISIKSHKQLAKWIKISNAEAEAILACSDKYKWAITPYYASLMDRYDENCPIRLQAIPNINELKDASLSEIDPVGDITNLKTRRIIHKYPNRVVFLVSNTCAVFCRHCTRKFHTSNLTGGSYYKKNTSLSFEQDFRYIENHTEIDDVLLTGGDPLTLSDNNLEVIISRLRNIKHVNIIRIGSRYPVFLPQRITENLCKILQKYHPVWLTTHFNHPKEITEESAMACDMLLRYGIPVQNQSVLLKGINDNVDTMRFLLKKLLHIRVRPYYLYHNDNVMGVSHFSTTIEKGMEIMDSLIGFETGFSIPMYVITTKLGKIPITREYLFRRNGKISVKNYKNEVMDITEYLRN